MLVVTSADILLFPTARRTHHHHISILLSLSGRLMQSALQLIGRQTSLIDPKMTGWNSLLLTPSPRSNLIKSLPQPIVHSPVQSWAEIWSLDGHRMHA
jgi:hypothetical protein